MKHVGLRAYHRLATGVGLATFIAMIVAGFTSPAPQAGPVSTDVRSIGRGGPCLEAVCGENHNQVLL
jgi:hypothetical protein